MARRKKPYTKKMMFFDIFLTCITSFMWLAVVVPFRELYMHSSA